MVSRKSLLFLVLFSLGLIGGATTRAVGQVAETLYVGAQITDFAAALKVLSSGAADAEQFREILEKLEKLQDLLGSIREQVAGLYAFIGQTVDNALEATKQRELLGAATGALETAQSAADSPRESVEQLQHWAVRLSELRNTVMGYHTYVNVGTLLVTMGAEAKVHDLLMRGAPSPVRKKAAALVLTSYYNYFHEGFSRSKPWSLQVALEVAQRAKRKAEAELDSRRPRNAELRGPLGTGFWVGGRCGELTLGGANACAELARVDGTPETGWTVVSGARLFLSAGCGGGALPPEESVTNCDILNGLGKDWRNAVRAINAASEGLNASKQGFALVTEYRKALRLE